MSNATADTSLSVNNWTIIILALQFQFQCRNMVFCKMFDYNWWESCTGFIPYVALVVLILNIYALLRDVLNFGKAYILVLTQCWELYLAVSYVNSPDFNQFCSVYGESVTNHSFCCYRFASIKLTYTFCIMLHLV